MDLGALAGLIRFAPILTGEPFDLADSGRADPYQDHVAGQGLAGDQGFAATSEACAVEGPFDVIRGSRIVLLKRQHDHGAGQESLQQLAVPGVSAKLAAQFEDADGRNEKLAATPECAIQTSAHGIFVVNEPDTSRGVEQVLQGASSRSGG